jgi:hypothetical protein
VQVIQDSGDAITGIPEAAVNIAESGFQTLKRLSEEGYLSLKHFTVDKLRSVNRISAEGIASVKHFSLENLLALKQISGGGLATLKHSSVEGFRSTLQVSHLLIPRCPYFTAYTLRTPPIHPYLTLPFFGPHLSA